MCPIGKRIGHIQHSSNIVSCVTNQSSTETVSKTGLLFPNLYDRVYSLHIIANSNLVIERQAKKHEAQHHIPSTFWDEFGATNTDARGKEGRGDCLLRIGKSTSICNHVKPVSWIQTVPTPVATTQHRCREWGAFNIGTTLNGYEMCLLPVLMIFLSLRYSSEVEPSSYGHGITLYSKN